MDLGKSAFRIVRISAAERMRKGEGRLGEGSKQLKAPFAEGSLSSSGWAFGLLRSNQEIMLSTCCLILGRAIEN